MSLSSNSDELYHSRKVVGLATYFRMSPQDESFNIYAFNSTHWVTGQDTTTRLFVQQAWDGWQWCHGYRDRHFRNLQNDYQCFGIRCAWSISSSTMHPPITAKPTKCSKQTRTASKTSKNNIPMEQWKYHIHIRTGKHLLF
ncbi:uncharacterized protein [Amphiura filiformis]|uniref:uncharacterized protein n=1 Tax=Amphiura filiformis TaxID=82378 RepID=UPI003B21284D